MYFLTAGIRAHCYVDGNDPVERGKMEEAGGREDHCRSKVSDEQQGRESGEHFERLALGKGT